MWVVSFWAVRPSPQDAGMKKALTQLQINDTEAESTSNKFTSGLLDDGPLHSNLS